MTLEPTALAADSADKHRLQQEETNVQIASATGILALGNILSRVLGLAREMALTFLFGATGAVDALQVAIIIPKALYDLLIGGHVNGAIVPVLSEIITLKGRDELWRVVSLLLSLLTVILALLVILIVLFSRQIVLAVSGGATTQTLSLAADLLRLTSPALIFMGLFAILSGALYALKSFTWPALAGMIFNGSIVLVTLLAAPSLSLVPRLEFDLFPFIVARPPQGIVVAALGWLFGALVQMLLQFPGLRGAHLRPSFDWRNPVLRRIGLLYAPVMFSLVMDTLVIRPFSYNLASYTGTGSIAYMNWATTLIQFPQGLVATAISIAILPTLAQQAALVNAESLRAFKDTLGMGLRLAITLILPAAVGLFVLAGPIVVLLFEHGAFTPADTQITAEALRWYLPGLPFAAVDLLLVYAFYARKDTLTPALIGILSLIVYMVTALSLVETQGLFSLMIADSVKHLVHALVSAYWLLRQTRGLGQQRLGITMLKTSLAALLMGAAATLTLPTLVDFLGSGGIIQEALVVAVGAALYGGIFLAAALLLKIEELTWMGALLRRKLFGR